jgi:7,8-dihydropterin-6-yl-methyl-4-(beta-D-ribofuranosyl)aminobenzene 5'-phosphate synthase
MQAKITILADNTAGPGALLAEHGWSALIEVMGHKVLLDTGQGRAALANADALGIDIRQIDAVVLSHGHVDHTAGLLPLLARTGPKPVFAHPDALEPKYRRLGEQHRFIGMPCSREALSDMCGHLRLERGSVEVCPGIVTTGEIPRQTGFEHGDADLMTHRAGGMEVDALLDDQALVVQGDEGLVIVLGCAHAGIVNTLLAARRLCGRSRIRAVIGGSHLGFLSGHQVEATLAALQEMGPELLVLGHCTGPKAAARLYHQLGDVFRFSHSGLSMTFQV